MYDGHLTGEQAVEVFDGRTLEEAVRRAHALGIAVQAYAPRQNRMLVQEPDPGVVLLIDGDHVAWLNGTRSPVDHDVARATAEDAHELVGLTAAEAVRRVTERNWVARVVRVEGLGLTITADLVPYRLNLTLSDGVVTKVERG